MPNRMLYRLSKRSLIVALWYCRLLYARQVLLPRRLIPLAATASVGVFLPLLLLVNR